MNYYTHLIPGSGRPMITDRHLLTQDLAMVHARCRAEQLIARGETKVEMIVVDRNTRTAVWLGLCTGPTNTDA